MTINQFADMNNYCANASPIKDIIARLNILRELAEHRDGQLSCYNSGVAEGLRIAMSYLEEFIVSENKQLPY